MEFLEAVLQGDAPEAALPSRSPRVRVRKRPALEFIQIFGERNSGTKHLKALISGSALEPDKILGAYATKTDPVNKARMIGYKHYYPRPEKIAKHQKSTLFLVIYKNPYTWIRSMLVKPYHFKGSLEGKGIEDLPGLKLAGFDVHGKEIPDVHPETGELLTMFGLREHKIRAWEGLASMVDNVAYINYEDLLLNPTAVVTHVVEEFPALFNGTVPDHVADPKYLAKYISPEPFSEAEMAVLNAGIEWEAEAIAGYEKDNLFIPH
ncbi:MAG: hypothetical protein AAGA87_10670 [Pseudomonadota bacterium]